MEFRCESCSHVGEPVDVSPAAGGMRFECANCGHDNILELGGGVGETSGDTGDASASSADDEAGSSNADALSDDAPTASATELAAATGVNLENLKVDDRSLSRGFGSNEEIRSYLRKDAVAALIPEPGPGPRCPKCGKKIEPDVVNCSRCGLNQREARELDPGELPWEQPPEGKEGEYEQAGLLWDALDDDWDADALEGFVDFIKEHELLDLGIRKLRFHLIEHPDDELAKEQLRELAESLQSRIIIAQVQAQASAEEFQDEVSRYKTRMITVALLFWGGIFLLFLGFFWDNCSTVA